MTNISTRILGALSGLLGAAGVAGAAAAAHGLSDGILMLAAGIALVHAPALLALALAPEGRLRWPAIPGALLALGVLLFSGDLAWRAFLGGRFFPSAAPTGGLLLMVGWLGVAVSALAVRGARS